MVRLTLLTLAVATLCPAAASACMPGTISDYLTLGLDGCTLGGRLFSDFGLGTLSAGSTDIDPGSVLVTPIDGGSSATLRFTYNTTAAGPAILESAVTLLVTLPAFRTELVSLRLVGAAASGDAAVVGVGNLCRSVFLGDFCEEPLDSLVVAAAAFGGTTVDTRLLAGVSQFGLSQDIVIDGGPSGSGSASLNAAEVTFTNVPEPGTAATIAAGVFVVLALRLRRRNQFHSAS